MIELAVDVALGGLLLLTAGWCALVHHRLRRLRTERGEMEGFITALTAATERAEAAIAGLREVIGEAERGLREQGELARHRAGELARLGDSGSRVLRRLEAALHQGARTVAEVAVSREQRPEQRPGTARPGTAADGGWRSASRPESRPGSPVGTTVPLAPASAGGRHDPAAAEELLKALGTLR